MFLISVALSIQGTWRSGNYVNTFRLVDGYSFMEWVGELYMSKR